MVPWSVGNGRLSGTVNAGLLADFGKALSLPRGLNNSFFGRVGTLHWVQFNVA